MHHIFIVTGLGFGDETKGATVDALCRAYPDIDLVVRHNGGAQAAHNVVTPDGTHHTFAQWGSGSLVGGVDTFLSKFMLVNPSRMVVETQVLFDKFATSAHSNLFVDADALVTTPFHVWLNRVRESARGAASHGTTGMGISETVLDGIARPDSVMRCDDLLGGRSHIRRKLRQIEEILTPELRRLGGELEFKRLDIDRIVSAYILFQDVANILSSGEVEVLLNARNGIVFEGAQGVLLDQDVGFHPHTTWSNTTGNNAMAILAENNVEGPVVHIGVTRTYTTRHGAGPFPTESAALGLAEHHNEDDGPAGQFRMGFLDLPLLKYAVNACPAINALAVSHADCAPKSYCARNPYFTDNTPFPLTTQHQEGLCRLAWQRVDGSMLEPTPNDFPDFIAEQLRLPLMIVGSGPTYMDRTFPTRIT